MNSKQPGKDVDRRSDIRLATRVEAVIEDAAHGQLIFTASGFSRAGAFLQRRDNSTPLPAVGSQVELTFNWPLETNIPPVRVQATVVHQADNGVGVKFEIAKT